MKRRPRQTSRIRQCESCGETKIIAARGLCRGCYSAWQHRNKNESPEQAERRRELHRQQYHRMMQDPERAAKHKAYMDAYKTRPGVRERGIAASKNSHTLSKYGMTVAQREELLRNQGGKCKLCETPIVFKRGHAKDTAHVDHCHDSNQVRGVLCAQCNTSIGKLGDTATALERAVRYLRGEL